MNATELIDGVCGVVRHCHTFSSIICLRIERAMVSASSRVSSCTKIPARHYSRFSSTWVAAHTIFYGFALWHRSMRFRIFFVDRHKRLLPSHSYILIPVVPFCASSVFKDSKQHCNYVSNSKEEAAMGSQSVAINLCLCIELSRTSSGKYRNFPRV